LTYVNDIRQGLWYATFVTIEHGMSNVARHPGVVRLSKNAILGRYFLSSPGPPRRGAATNIADDGTSTLSTGELNVQENLQ
jgi:hypothetical protein